MTPSMETWAPTMIFRMRHSSPERSSSMTGRSASRLRRCLRKDRQQETTRIADLERAALPLRVVRVGLERDAGVPGPLGDLVDVTRRRRDGQPHADSLLAIAPLLPIVLVQADLGP